MKGQLLHNELLIIQGKMEEIHKNCYKDDYASLKAHDLLIDLLYIVSKSHSCQLVKNIIETYKRIPKQIHQGVFTIDIYNPFKKTALQRKTLSKPMRILLENKYFIKPVNSILDYGCGHGTDVKILNEKYFLDIYGYDKYNPKFDFNFVLEKEYDVVTCNYVFNVIPSPTEHKLTLNLLKSLGDNIYISVRADKKAVKDTWKYDDVLLGYWTPKGSFQRFYNEERVAELFGQVEYIHKDSSLLLFKIQK